MAIKFVSIKCPECGAALDIEEGRKQIFCSYCGMKVLMDNDNEHIYRRIDEAEIKKAEVDKVVQLRKMELLEKKRAAKEKSKKIKVFLSVVLVIFAVIFIGLGFGGSNFGLAMPGMVCCYVLLFMWLNNKDKEDEDIDFGDKIKVPPGAIDYENKNYAAIEAMFRSAGFNNVKSIPLNDLTVGFLKKPGMVEDVTINGHSITSEHKKYSSDASVVISYHSHR